MSVHKVYIFWTAGDDVRPWLLSELAAGRLRQGWGPPGSSLTRNGKLLSLDEWAPAYNSATKVQWDWTSNFEDARKRYAVLSRMAAFDTGDIVVIPKMPKEGQFTIATVTAGGYDFDAGLARRKDFCHMIRVDKDSMRTYGYESSPEAAAVAAKLHHRRAAVNNINDVTYAGQIRSLYANSGTFQKF